MARQTFKTKMKFFMVHNGQHVVFRRYQQGKCIGEAYHGKLSIDKYGLFWILKENVAIDGNIFMTTQSVSTGAFRDIDLVNANTFRQEMDLHGGMVFCFVEKIS